jgi:hypothetical protein
MRLTLQPLREQRLTGLFFDAGTPFIWYHFITAENGTAAYGIGPTPYYVTGRITAMWQQAGQNVQNMAGGQLPVGQEVIYCREKIPTADRLSYAGGTYEVVAEPQPARLMGTDFCWKTVIKRG